MEISETFDLPKSFLMIASSVSKSTPFTCLTIISISSLSSFSDQLFLKSNFGGSFWVGDGGGVGGVVITVSFGAEDEVV